MSSQISAKAVEQQLNAMPHTRYEVGLLDLNAKDAEGNPILDDEGNATERMLLRRWDRATIEKALGFLRRSNMDGMHVYIRPQGEHGYTLLDDLDHSAIAAMKRDGFAPALVVETSPGNLQAWVAHGETLNTTASTAAAKVLAERFGGDPGSADWRHFGRLAGFTNRKEKYRQSDGRFPFVRFVEGTGLVYPAAKEFVVSIRAQVANEQKRLERVKQQRMKQIAADPGALRYSIQDYRNNPRYQGDGHRADLAFAAYALARGASDAVVASAIRTRDLTHKGSEARQDDYVDRTIEKARASLTPSKGPSR